MIKFFKILVAGLFCSFFLFPIDISGWPINSKMTLAVVGLMLFVFNKIRDKNSSINSDFVWISLIALGVSAIAQLATIYNHTPVKEYTDYIMSFWVWMGAAYAVVQIIKSVHGEVTVPLICNYLIGVGVFQCVTAYAIVISPAVQSLVDSILAVDYAWSGRLYGLGAFVDPSGLRFAAILIIIAARMTQTLTDVRASILYILAFFIIGSIGNMISRTTTMGIILGVGYMIVDFIVNYQARSANAGSLGIILILSSIFVLFTVYLYNSNEVFHKNFRFGFEGFFSYFERGQFQTGSTDVLKTMYIFPDDLKTWLIGDGYFANPGSDPNYLGRIRGGYYMGTDVGYLRFIFFFGIFGLVLMISMFVKATSTCIKYLSEYKLLFVFLLLSNFVGWFKVCSDIIMVFALFLVLAYQGVDETNEIV